MNRYRLIMACLCLLAVATAALADTPATKEDMLRQRVRDVGAADLVMAIRPNGVAAELQDVAGHPLATVTAERSATSRRFTWRATDGDAFTLTWSPLIGEVVLETGAGERFVRAMNPETGAISETPEARVAFEQRVKEIAVMAEVVIHSDVAIEHAARAGNILQPRADYSECTGCSINVGGGTLYDDGGGEIGSGFYSAGVTCGTNWVRGYAVGQMSRSQICEAAKSDANVKCSNGLCLGCCYLSDCDAHCAVGDYLCSTGGVSGRYCVKY